MKTSDSVSKITEALIAFQCESPTLTKDREGYGYKYVTLDNIINVTKPILLKYKLVIIQSVGESANGVMITTRLQHVSGEYFEDSFSLPGTTMKNVNNVQAMGASISYGKRYGIGAMLNISVDEDNDAATPAQKPQQQPAVTNPLDLKILALIKQTGLKPNNPNWNKQSDNIKQDMILWYEQQIKEQK